jgi:two-component system, sensor histidine kinase
MASAAPGGVSRRILVADDDPDGVETLAIVLRADGHDVRVASDGPITLEVGKEFLPHVVFLDLGMPGMHGYEIAGELRRMDGLDTTLLVALTGYSRELDRQRAYEAGFDVFLVKPTSPKLLA